MWTPRGQCSCVEMAQLFEGGPHTPQWWSYFLKSQRMRWPPKLRPHHLKGQWCSTVGRIISLGSFSLWGRAAGPEPRVNEWHMTALTRWQDVQMLTAMLSIDSWHLSMALQRSRGDNKKLGHWLCHPGGYSLVTRWRDTSLPFKKQWRVHPGRKYNPCQVVLLF